MNEIRDPFISQIKIHLPFVVLLLVYISTSIWLTFRLPAFSTPNENLHYEYVALLRRTGKLPDPSLSHRMDERHQPPLYYSLVSLASSMFPRPLLDNELEKNPFYFGTEVGNRNPFLHTTPTAVPALYLGRLVSMFLGAVAIIAIYIAALLTYAYGIGLLISGLVAFQPMFLFLSSSLSNDLAVTAIGAILIAFTTFLIVRGKSFPFYLLWGVLFGLAMITKANAIFLILLLPIACFAKVRQTGSLRTAFACGLGGILGLSPIYGFWLIFNQARELDTLGVSSSLPIERVVGLGLEDLVLIRPHLFTLWRSFWLDWSAGEAGYTETWVYVISAVLIAVALLGWVKQPPASWTNRCVGLMHLLWPLPLIALFIGTKTLMVKEAGFLVPEGRWLLPIIPSFAWLIGGGFSRWWPSAQRSRVGIYSTIVIALVTLTLLFLFIPSINPRAKQLANIQQVEETAMPVGLTYGDQITLMAIDLDYLIEDKVNAVSLYWKAESADLEDLIISADLYSTTSEGWESLDGFKTYHGNGLSPTGVWENGELYLDQIFFRPKRQLNGPTIGLVTIHVLNNDGRLPIYRDEKQSVDAIVKDVIIYPEQPLSPDEKALLTTPVNFGGYFELIGSSVDDHTDGMKVTLWWRALKPATLDYTTFVHLVDEQGNLVTQSDSIPDNGSSPTHIWRSGDVIRDTHTLTANAPTAGSLLIGAYDLETLTRLAANIDEVPLVDDVYRLQLPQSGNYITTLHSRIHRHKPPFPNTRNFRPGSQIFWHIESSKQLPVEPSGLSLPWPLGPRATGCRIDFC